MIVYKDVLKKLSDIGYSPKRIRKERLLSESVLTSLRNNKHINTDTVNTICLLLNCQPNDIIEVVYEPGIVEVCRQKCNSLLPCTDMQQDNSSSQCGND